MKRIMLALWLACLALGAVAQQQEKLTIKRVPKGQEPQAVIDALEKDFPGATSKELSFLPGKIYGDEWYVDLESDELSHDDFYQVTFKVKQGNRDYTAVYDNEGKLLSSKEIIHGATLPADVIETLKKFQDWRIDDTHELIKYKEKKGFKNYYKVKLQKGGEHKTIYLDAFGEIIDTRFTVI